MCYCGIYMLGYRYTISKNNNSDLFLPLPFHFHFHDLLFSLTYTVMLANVLMGLMANTAKATLMIAVTTNVRMVVFVKI